MILNTDELNSRIVENDEHILLIFDNYFALNLYRRNWGRNYKKLLFTIYDINNGKLVGLRYKKWHFVTSTELHDMIVSRKDLFNEVQNGSDDNEYRQYYK